MKLLLCAGAALMIGASIYGFADYKKTRHKNEFNQMYTDDAGKKTVQPATVVKDVKTTAEKNAAETTIAVKKEESKTDKPLVSAGKKKAEKKSAKKRKLRFSEFSRAPIKE